MFGDYAGRVFRWLRGRKPPPSDPDSFVRQPVRRGPPSLAAVAYVFGAMLKKASRQQ